jgi:competence protein ComEA
MRKVFSASIALAMLAVPAAIRSQETEAPALPAGPGHDTMVRVCSACHAPEIAAQQRLNRAGWDELVETMVSRGAQANEAEVAEIKAYLAKNFPEQPAAPAAPSK